MGCRSGWIREGGALLGLASVLFPYWALRTLISVISSTLIFQKTYSRTHELKLVLRHERASLAKPKMSTGLIIAVVHGKSKEEGDNKE